MADKLKETSDPERDASYETPATFCDRFYVSAGPAIVRISFGEEGPAGVRYRQAAMMSRENATALANLLAGILSQSDPKVKGN